MCIGSNWVNQAQDLMFVTKFEDFPYSLIPNGHAGGGGSMERAQAREELQLNF